MGLELVEVVLTLEEKFGVTFDDESLESMRTVADLTDFLQRNVPRVPPAVPSPCVTSIAFFRLRAAVTALAPEKRALFHPATRFDALFSPKETFTLWPELRARSGLRLPRLVRRRSMVAFTIAATILTVAGIDWLLSGWSVVFAALIIPAGLFAESVTRRLRSQPESRPRTVGEFVREVGERNLGPLRCELGVPFTREEIFAGVRDVLATSLHLDPNVIRPDARLVEDLGAG